MRKLKCEIVFFMPTSLQVQIETVTRVLLKRDKFTSIWQSKNNMKLLKTSPCVIRANSIQYQIGNEFPQYYPTMAHDGRPLHIINIIFATVLEHPDINNSQNNYAA